MTSSPVGDSCQYLLIHVWTAAAYSVPEGLASLSMLRMTLRAVLTAPAASITLYLPGSVTSWSRSETVTPRSYLSSVVTIKQYIVVDGVLDSE